MKLGICVTPDTLSEAAQAGFEYAELSVYALQPALSEADYAPFGRRLADSPLPIEAFNCFLPAQMRVTGPEVDRVRLQAYMDTVLRRASALGAAIMVFGSGSARRLPQNFPVEKGWDQLADAARLAADLAARYGMTIAMEPLFKRACNFFNLVEQGSVFIDLIAHPALKLLADLFHMEAEREPLANVVKAGARLVHMHVPTPSLPETADEAERPFADFFNVMRRAGYDGRLSLEDNNQLMTRSRAPRVDAWRAACQYLARLKDARG